MGSFLPCPCAPCPDTPLRRSLWCSLFYLLSTSERNKPFFLSKKPLLHFGGVATLSLLSVALGLLSLVSALAHFPLGGGALSDVLCFQGTKGRLGSFKPPLLSVVLSRFFFSFRFFSFAKKGRTIKTSSALSNK